MQVITKHPNLTFNHFKVVKLLQFIYNHRLCVIEEVIHPIIPKYYNGYVELLKRSSNHYDDYRTGVVEPTFKDQLDDKYPEEEKIQKKEFIGFSTIVSYNGVNVNSIEDVIIKVKDFNNKLMQLELTQKDL